MTTPVIQLTRKGAVIQDNWLRITELETENERILTELSYFKEKMNDNKEQLEANIRRITELKDRIDVITLEVYGKRSRL